ncbi:sensor histidine kinase [Agromyces larvae]|uniref:histidine kinase n=1 Tax=Agromyces larvae TaxID=2929802 RepID=A0ABY4C5P9_9MICO|nr:histidine kinase [Agromyces larvae]UOE44065.1 histidine kinase [Agromyces larvae]
MSTARFSAVRRHWDVALAVALVALAFVPGVEHQGVDLAELPDRPMDALGWTLLVAQGAAVAFVRRRPVASLAVVGTAFGAYQLLGYPTTFAALGLLVAVVAAGALARRPWVAAASAAVGYVLLAVALTWAASPTTPRDHIVFGMLLAALWAAGAWLRARSQAQELRRHESERRAVDLERSRIARELHDVITHHVTAMVIQADAAQVRADDREHTTAVLSAIGEAGRAALTDLRGLLGALDEAEDAPTTAPAVADLGDVIARARAAGQPVEYLREGPLRPLATAPALAVTRVVQEALTNAMKHARGAATVVRVRYEEDGVDVTVTTRSATEPGPGRGGGRGLIGLRERVALVGGRLEAAPVDGGFVVHARVPA